MAYDIRLATYKGSVSVGAQVGGNPGLQCVAFKSDGSKMYVVSQTNDATYQYALSTAWDVTTATYEKAGPTGDAHPQGLTFKSDGTRMYVSGNDNNVVTQYTLSTAWDIGTAGSAATLAVSSGPTGLAMSGDGTKLYVCDNLGDDVRQYDLATAWDVTTGAFAASVSVLTQESDVRGVEFSSDGTMMFAIGISSDTVYRYDLSTAWSVSTATYSGTSLYVAGETGSFPEGLRFSADGTRLFVAASGTHAVYQYALGRRPTVGYVSL